MAKQTDEYEKGLNGCEHEWRHVGDTPYNTKSGGRIDLAIKWCTKCGCMAKENEKGKWYVMYPDAQDGSGE